MMMIPQALRVVGIPFTTRSIASQLPISGMRKKSNMGEGEARHICIRKATAKHFAEDAEVSIDKVGA